MGADLNKIGVDISAGIRELGILPDDLASFLESPRGLALTFWAMNESWKGQGESVFHVTKDEWVHDKPVDWCPVHPILNCHTHYIQPGHGKGVTHWGSQYRQGAHRHWWLFPEAYQLAFGANGDVTATLRPASHPLHVSQNYLAHMSHAYAAHNGRMAFLLVPAPGPSGLMDGSETDIASQQDMRQLAEIINGFCQHEICRVAGVIKCDADAPLIPATINDNPSRAWKIYPAALNWTEAGQHWLVRELPKALDKLVASGERHTVCIHWWDGAAEPWDPSNSTDQLNEVVANNRDVNFVLFHACYPFHDNLAQLVAKHPNLYAEIGGTFANQILGLHGQDDGVPASPPAAPGLPSAIEMINTLRGNKRQNDGKIVFGTDAIWHGSPVWQVEAFKRLVLSPNNKQDRRFKKNVLSANTKNAFPGMA